MRRAALPLLLAAAAAAPLPGAAQQKVALQGLLGNRALLIVDGGAPRAVAPGDTHQGVRVVSTGDDQAVLEFGGRRHVLRVGEAPASVGAAAPGSGGNQRVVLTAGAGGHFMPEGRINGRPVVFMLDTGATSVAMGAAQAERLGIDYRAGPPLALQTANGTVTGWRVRLGSLHLGDVELHDVDAVVMPATMSFVLLGNSVLSRFSMQRDGARMVLERRY